MLRYEHVKYANDKQWKCIVAAEAEHHNEFGVVGPPLRWKWIAYVECDVIYFHRLRENKGKKILYEHHVTMSFYPPPPTHPLTLMCDALIAGIPIMPARIK